MRCLFGVRQQVVDGNVEDEDVLVDVEQSRDVGVELADDAGAAAVDADLGRAAGSEGELVGGGVLGVDVQAAQQ